MSRSEDAIYLDASHWDEDLQSEALSLREEFDIMREVKRTDFRVLEYPDVPTRSSAAPRATKGRDRNLPCPCGSGRKFKKCCGSNS